MQLVTSTNEEGFFEFYYCSDISKCRLQEWQNYGKSFGGQHDTGGKVDWELVGVW